MGLTFAELTESPLGPISFVAGDKGLERISFTTLEILKTEQSLTEVEPSLKGLEVVGTLLAEMNAFLFGILKNFSVYIDWDQISGFQRDVLKLADQIPYGELISYGEVAKRLGKPGAARAVGKSLGANPMPIVIPCHRVVSADNEMRGYIGGIKSKAFLLGLEGHRIEGNRIAE